MKRTSLCFQAGIVTKGNEHKLVIALEPEAASVWCKKLPADGFITQNHDRDALDESPGTQYIVVDCGGKVLNTINIWTEVCFHIGFEKVYCLPSGTPGD